ncbi:MAG: hypothetical protein WCI17_05810 [bacterium]
MGLFSSLFGRKPAQFTERIWLNTERKLIDLIARVQRGDDCAQWMRLNYRAGR